MVTPKLMEAWFRLIAEAMRGTAEAQAAVRSLTESATDPEEMARWMVRFLPPGTDTSGYAAFGEWLEEWWRMMGFVPRSRYLELLERYEILRARLEEAERTIQHLRAMLGVRGQEEEARKVLDLWETALQETLKTQAEWMRTWMAVGSERTDSESDTQ
jgi:hypothetical protein